MGKRLLSRIALRNYRSIAVCDVSPGPLTFLIGPNGAGKSNFLDALRFVADSLRLTMEHAIRARGGINQIRRRSNGHPASFAIRLEFDLDDRRGHLAVEIAARGDGGYRIRREECSVEESGGAVSHYALEDCVVRSSNIYRPPAPVPNQLYLMRASSVDVFRPVNDALSSMGFYNLNPDAMRSLRLPDMGDLLQRDARNIASVLLQLAVRSPTHKRTIERYLGAIARGIVGVNARRFGPEEGLEFVQSVDGAAHPWRFHSVGMSDGTLRALGVLTALFQRADASDNPHLVGIEEPEIALHPSALGALLDSFRDASQNAQVLVTTHSPELLDDKDLTDNELLAVAATNGRGRVGPIDEAGRNTLRQRLCTPGELLRMGQIRPDPRIFEVKTRKSRLFGEAVRAGSRIPVDAPSDRRRVPS